MGSALLSDLIRILSSAVIVGLLQVRLAVPRPW